MGRGWCWVGGGLGHGPPSSAASRGWLRCRVKGRLISQRVRRSLRIVASIIYRLWLSAGFEAGAPYAGARTAELEKAKGTSDEINSVVASAQASRVPAGHGFLMFSSVEC
jgi:hypothetical protein